MAKAAVVCRRNRVPLAVAEVAPDLAQSSPRSLVELCSLCHNQFPCWKPAANGAARSPDLIAPRYARESDIANIAVPRRATHSPLTVAGATPDLASSSQRVRDESPYRLRHSHIPCCRPGREAGARSSRPDSCTLCAGVIAFAVCHRDHTAGRRRDIAPLRVVEAARCAGPYPLCHSVINLWRWRMVESVRGLHHDDVPLVVD